MSYSARPVSTKPFANSRRLREREHNVLADNIVANRRAYVTGHSPEVSDRLSIGFNSPVADVIATLQLAITSPPNPLQLAQRFPSEQRRKHDEFVDEALLEPRQFQLHQKLHSEQCNSTKSSRRQPSSLSPNLNRPEK